MEEEKEKEITPKIHYDLESDILYVVFEIGPAGQTTEITKNFWVEHGKDGQIVGFEIWKASKVFLDIAPLLIPKKKPKYYL